MYESLGITEPSYREDGAPHRSFGFGLRHDERRPHGTTIPCRSRGAAEDALTGLLAIGARISLDRGSVAYHEGDPALHWYRVVSGTGCTSKLLSDRRQIGIFLHPGDVFGLEAVDAHSFAAEALTDMIVIRYPKRCLDGLAEADDIIGRYVREIACRSLTDAYERLLTLGRKTADERVATFLLKLARIAPDDKTITLTMSRTDIGDYLGLTLTTVSRTLTGLKQAGLIDIAGPRVLLLLDRAAIEKLSGGDSLPIRADRDARSSSQLDFLHSSTRVHQRICHA